MASEEEETPDRFVIRGIVLIFYYLAQSQIDTGATHSFIATTLVHTLELPVNVLTIPLRVTTLVRRNVTIDHVCRLCSLTIARHVHTWDSIVLIWQSLT